LDIGLVVPILLVAAGLLMLLPSCTQLVVDRVIIPNRATALGLNEPPWSPGEQTEYRVLSRGDTYIGQVIFTFQKEADKWLLKRDSEMPRLEDHSLVKFSVRSLKPINEDRSIATGDGQMRVFAQYVGSKVEISFWSSKSTEKTLPPSPVSMMLSLPLDYYSNEQLLMLLRAIPFSTGYEASFTNVNTTSASAAIASVRVVGQENIDTLRGQLRAWKVQVSSGESVQQFWLQVESPHLLLKYDNGENTFVIAEATR